LLAFFIGAIRIEWNDDSRRFESRNLNYAGIAAIGAEAKLVNSIGIREIEAHIIELEGYLIKKMIQRPYKP